MNQIDKEVDVQNQEVSMKQQARVRADAKGRVSLAKFLGEVLPLDLDVVVESDGTIRLTPLATIPARELWLYRNPKALESLREGIEQAGNGKVTSRGSFAKHVDDKV